MTETPKYMIHACPQRMWYVTEFLVPSMLEQGIPEADITIWNDTEKRGNLAACMAAFESLQPQAPSLPCSCW